MLSPFVERSGAFILLQKWISKWCCFNMFMCWWIHVEKNKTYLLNCFLYFNTNKNVTLKYTKKLLDHHSNYIILIWCWLRVSLTLYDNMEANGMRAIMIWNQSKYKHLYLINVTHEWLMIKFWLTNKLQTDVMISYHFIFISYRK